MLVLALSMVTSGKTNGMENYLAINGRARVTEGGASELLNQLAQIYIAPGTTGSPPLIHHRDLLPTLLLNVFMASDHGASDIELCTYR